MKHGASRRSTFETADQSAFVWARAPSEDKMSMQSRRVWSGVV